ncbi:MAG: PQQ-dependent sugar dehydrogenase, partial [Emticicia sp.]
MQKHILFSLAFSTLTYASCAQSASTSVETKAPNSTYPSAFQGQTRVGAVKTQTPYEAKVLTEGLTSPWGVKGLPDGRLIITEKSGVMRIVKASGELSKPITGAPAVNSDGQGGLLGITLDPNFQKNRMIYWTFSENVTGGTHTS